MYTYYSIIFILSKKDLCIIFLIEMIEYPRFLVITVLP